MTKRADGVNNMHAFQVPELLTFGRQPADVPPARRKATQSLKSYSFGRHGDKCLACAYRIYSGGRDDGYRSRRDGGEGKGRKGQKAKV